jgi:predicted double-glycine peptidase
MRVLGSKGMCLSAGIRRVAAPALVLSLLTAAACSGPPEGRGRKVVRSLEEIRHDRVVLQRWDLSCGSAALSTLLTFDVGDPVSEEEIIASMLQRADPVKIRARQGFSLLDLKRYAVARGHEADGYGNLDLQHLAQLAPAIVPTVIGGNDHFVVFRALRAGHVFLADPGYGNRSMTVEQFDSIWPRHIAFVVNPSDEQRASPSKPDLTLVQPPVVREAVGALR